MCLQALNEIRVLTKTIKFKHQYSNADFGYELISKRNNLPGIYLYNIPEESLQC